MELLHLAFAVGELLLAVMLWHFAAPAVFLERKARAWKVWLLGMTLAILATGQLQAVMGMISIPMIRMFGDAALLIYGTLRYRGIVRHAPPPHWSELP